MTWCNPFGVRNLLRFFFNIDLVAILFDSSLETESYNHVSISPILIYNGLDALALHSDNHAISMGGSVDYGLKSICSVQWTSLEDGEDGGMMSPIIIPNLQSDCHVQSNLRPINRLLGGHLEASGRGVLTEVFF